MSVLFLGELRAERGIGTNVSFEKMQRDESMSRFFFSLDILGTRARRCFGNSPEPRKTGFHGKDYPARFDSLRREGGECERNGPSFSPVLTPEAGKQTRSIFLTQTFTSLCGVDARLNNVTAEHKAHAIRAAPFV